MGKTLILIFFLCALPVSAANIYVAQSFAGGNTGADCADAIALSGVTWTAGNTYHKAGCGTTGCINLNGLSYFLIDGSPSATPCGVVSGTAVSCNGTISATGTGSGQSSSDSIGIYARGGGSNIEIRNLNIANMYVCGTVTSQVSPGVSGTNGNLISIIFEIGASISNRGSP